jgi:hypothetical protein
MEHVFALGLSKIYASACVWRNDSLVYCVGVKLNNAVERQEIKTQTKLTLTGGLLGELRGPHDKRLKSGNVYHSMDLFDSDTDSGHCLREGNAIKRYSIQQLEELRIRPFDSHHVSARRTQKRVADLLCAKHITENIPVF